MRELHFEWDQRKEKGNVKKHGVSFEEARTAFYDENAIQFYDPDHSDEKDRRIVSARKADKDEELEYWKQRK